jgi:hypothetical protein
MKKCAHHVECKILPSLNLLHSTAYISANLLYAEYFFQNLLLIQVPILNNFVIIACSGGGGLIATNPGSLQRLNTGRAARSHLRDVAVSRIPNEFRNKCTSQKRL